VRVCIVRCMEVRCIGAVYANRIEMRVGLCHLRLRRLVSRRVASSRLVSSRVVLFLFAKSGVHRARREGNAGQVYYGIYRLPAGLKRRNEDTSEE